MTPWCCFRLALPAALSVLASAPLALAGSGPFVPTLQPYQVSSPRGTYLFEVIPSDRHGAGSSDVTLTNRKTGEIAWKRELPYTFWQACVTDDGTVGGFGYSKGPMLNPFQGQEGGDFFVRILDFKGRLKHEETTKRPPSAFYVPTPYADSLVLDAENDRMVILMNNRSFRSYNLLTGNLTSAVLMSPEKLPKQDFSLNTFYSCPRTPLLLLELSNWTEKDGAETPGTVFALMNVTGDLVWAFNHEWTLPEDWNEFENCKVLSVSPIPNNYYVGDADPFADGDNPPNADDSQPVAHFDLYLAGNTDGQRLSFQISRAGERDAPQWKVAEVNRVQWNLPKDNDVPASLPRLEANLLGGFHLPGADGKPLGELADVALGPHEQIYALEGGSRVVHVFNRAGKPLHRCRPEKDDQIDLNGSPLTVSDTAEVFVKLVDTLFDQAGAYVGPNPKAGHRLHFSPEGVLHEKLLSLGRDGLGAEWFAQPSSTNILISGALSNVELVRRDQHHSQAANLTHRPDGNWLEHILDISFAPDGSFAIRDSSMADYPTPFPVPPSHRPREAVSIYDRHGEPLRRIDFTHGASFDRIAYDGAHLVATRSFHLPHPFVYVLKETGAPIGIFPVEFFVGNERPNPRPFLVSGGKEILIIDLTTARAFRYAMPE